jgi:hypothetical protein
MLMTPFFSYKIGYGKKFEMVINLFWTNFRHENKLPQKWPLNN